MNRRTIWYMMSAATLGLGLAVLSNRERVGFLARETSGEVAPEGWPKEFAKQTQEISQRIEETGQALDEAIRESRRRAGGAAESMMEGARKAGIGILSTALWTGLLTAFLVFVYAPERYQQQRVWNFTRSVMASTWGAMTGLLRLGGGLRRTMT